MSDSADLPLLKGTLDLLILKALSWGPLHGYGLASWLEQRSRGALVVDDSALYQALHRLEGRGQIEGAWGVTDTNRRARFYTLTADGRRRLDEDASVWNRYAAAVGGILALSEPAERRG